MLLLQIRNQIVFNFQNESNMSNPSLSAPFIHSFIHITWPSGPIRQAPVAASPPPKKVRNCAISCSCHKCSTPSPLPPFYDAPALTFYLVCVCVCGAWSMFAPSAFVQLLQLPKRPLNIEFVVVVVGKLAHLLGQRGIQQMCVCVCTPAGPMPSPCDSMCVCFGANQQIHIKFIFTIAIHNQRHFKLNHSYSLTPTWPRPSFCFSPIPPIADKAH